MCWKCISKIADGMIIRTNLQKKSYCDCSRLCPTWAGPTIAGMSSLEQSVRFDILAALFRFLAIQKLACWIFFGSIFWFQFFLSHFFLLLPSGWQSVLYEVDFFKARHTWYLATLQKPLSWKGGAAPKRVVLNQRVVVQLWRALLNLRGFLPPTSRSSSAQHLSQLPAAVSQTVANDVALTLGLWHPTQQPPSLSLFSSSLSFPPLLSLSNYDLLPLLLLCFSALLFPLLLFCSLQQLFDPQHSKSLMARSSAHFGVWH